MFAKPAARNVSKDLKTCSRLWMRPRSVGINVLVVVHDDAARGRVFAGLIVAVVPAREALAIDPVAAVEPRVVEEAHRREEVRALALLRRALLDGVVAHGPDVHALAVGGNLLRAQISPFAVAGQNVIQAHGHLQRLVPVVEVAASLGVDVVVGLLREQLASRRVEAHEAQAVVEEHAAARAEAHLAILDEVFAEIGSHYTGA